MTAPALHIEPSDPLLVYLTAHARARLADRLALPECELRAQLAAGLYLPADPPRALWRHEQGRGVCRVVLWSALDETCALLVISAPRPRTRGVVTIWTTALDRRARHEGAPSWLQLHARALRLQGPPLLSCEARRMVAQAHHHHGAPTPAPAARGTR